MPEGGKPPAAFQVGDSVRVIRVPVHRVGVIVREHQSGNYTVEFSDRSQVVVTEEDLRRI